MKQYVIVLKNYLDIDSVEATKLQKAHLEKIARLSIEGKLILTGLFLDDSDIRVIYIFNITY